MRVLGFLDYLKLITRCLVIYAGAGNDLFVLLIRVTQLISLLHTSVTAAIKSLIFLRRKISFSVKDCHFVQGFSEGQITKYC